MSKSSAAIPISSSTTQSGGDDVCCIVRTNIAVAASRALSLRQ